MKKFIVIGPVNAATYKEIFPMVKDRNVFVRMNPMKFDGADSNVLCMWYNNIKEYKREPLMLTKTYNEAYYPKYDNYDAIEVSKVKDIPYDYEGVMGVPITFLDKWCGGQFEIMGVCCSHSKTTNCLPVIDGNTLYHRILIKKKVEFEVIGLATDLRCDEPWNIMGKPTYVDEHHKNCVKMVLDGKALYARILIRRKP